MADVVDLGPHERMTVEECVEFVHRNKHEFAEVIFLGVGPDGNLVIRTSGMPRKDAFWLLNCAIQYTGPGNG